MAAVLVAGALVAYFENRAIWGSIHHEAVTGLGKRPPKYATSAMNILVFGSDSRAGLTRREQLVLHVGRSRLRLLGHDHGGAHLARAAPGDRAEPARAT